MSKIALHPEYDPLREFNGEERRNWQIKCSCGQLIWANMSPADYAYHRTVYHRRCGQCKCEPCACDQDGTRQR